MRKVFLGRENELLHLRKLRNKRSSSLAVVTGRRRIGKSRLIHEFAREFPRFYEFQGVPPHAKASNTTQLKNFAEQLKDNFNCAEPIIHNWTEAFAELNKNLDDHPTLLFLDELSWMGKYDPEFPGKLKIAWDTKLSKRPGLVVVLCGSVSAWIEDNVLHSTDFVGRISLTILLEELELKHCLNFWGGRSSRISISERLRYLAVVGGVPKYLEEYDPSDSTQDNIRRLCFSKGGYLLNEFERTFSDIFERKSQNYKEIVRLIISEYLSPQALADKLEISSSGDFLTHLRNLELSGFIRRDYVYKPGGKRGKLSRVRISDNYLRFYLKYLEPNKEKVDRGIYDFGSLEQLVAWNSISGLQFENLVLNRLSEFIVLLGLNRENIVSASPYFQSRTTKTEACQIDLLIEARRNNFYICEIKLRDNITTQVITEVEKKLKVLKLPKYSSRRPVLIFSGELDDRVRDSEFFDKIVEVGAD